MNKLAAALFAALALSACAASSVGAGPEAPSGPGRIPGGAIELGDWRRTSPNSVAQRFNETVARRYGAGLALAQVTADLRRNEFSCAPAPRATRGDPPNQICRRVRADGECSHTWQVHLYGSTGLERTRGLYDRACGGDDLLGGPS